MLQIHLPGLSIKLLRRLAPSRPQGRRLASIGLRSALRLLFGEFQPHLKSQYSEQYNLTIERQITKDMLFRIGYVGTESHHLLASHDLNFGNSDSCLEIAAIANANPNTVLTASGGLQTTCGTFSSDSSYYIAPGTAIPAYAPPPQPFKVKITSCTGLVLPYNAGTGGNCLPANPVPREA